MTGLPEPTTDGRVSLWGGRFAGGPADALAELSRSTHFDWRLARHDIAGSCAHARVLHAAGLLDDATLAAMLDALDRLDADVASGEFRPDPSDEDVHTALERGLIERAGAEVGGRLRAGRSRNDQVVTLFRRYLRHEARTIAGLVLDVVDALVDQATRHLGVAMPGPDPPPARAAGAALAPSPRARVDAAARRRPAPRLGPPRRRVALRFRGARRAARSGSTPRRSRATSGSPRSVENSIDGTASRDFAAEFAFVAAMTAVDLSRIAEEVVLWATKEFSYVTLDDAYSTGSSIMPQKKNPDVAELARGKAGRLVGDLAGLLTTLEGPAAGVQPRPAGGQGTGLRRGRHARGAAAGVRRDGRHAAVQRRAAGVAGAAGLRAGHRRRGVAGAAGGSVPGGARGRRRVRPDLRGAGHRAVGPHRRGPRRRSTRSSRRASARCSPSRGRWPRGTPAGARLRSASGSSSNGPASAAAAARAVATPLA